MTPKILPTRRNHHFKKYNCTGKLRVDVLLRDGEVVEVILLPESGGCKYNLQLIGRMLTAMLECNMDIHYILSILEKTDPCPAPVSRMNREKLSKEEVGIGGCAKIILQAIKEKVNGEEKKVEVIEEKKQEGK